MKARQLIGKSSYGPDELKILFKAFDEAWEILAPSISSRADAIEVARLKLANIVLGVAQKGGGDDVEQIKNAALRAFAADSGR